MRLPVQLLRWRHPLLWLWLLAWAAEKQAAGVLKGNDWPWTIFGSDLLFGDHSRKVYMGQSLRPAGGLHLYANYPLVHMGPASLVVGRLLRLLDPGDRPRLAVLAMTVAAPPLVWLAERAAVRARGLRSALDEPLLALATLVSGAVFLVVWFEAAWYWAHPDEVLAVTCAAVVVWAVATRRPLVAGAAVGLGIGAKSWAIVLLPLLLCFPRRDLLRSGALALGLAAAAWLPFVIADPGTIHAAKAAVDNLPDSGLRVLGVDSSGTPGWLRPVQAIAGLALATVAVVSGRWAAALLAAVGTRLAIDPATWSYYTPALVFAALVWDLAGGRRAIPLWAPAMYAALELVPDVAHDDHVIGAARLAAGLAAAGLVLAPPLRRRSAPVPRTSAGTT